MIDEDGIIRARLLVDERLLKKVTKRLLTHIHNEFFHPTELGSFPSQNQHEQDLLQLEVAQYDLSLEKALLVDQMCSEEMSHYNEQLGLIESQIEAALGDIASLKQELSKERVALQQRQTYDAIAKQILDLPPLEEMERDIEQAQSFLERLEQEEQRLLQESETKREETISLLTTVQSYKDQMESFYEAAAQRGHALFAEDPSKKC